MQNRLVTTILISTLLMSISLDAKTKRGKHVVKEKQGQQYYLNACSKCHGAGKIGGNMATQREWKALLDANASELIYLHEDVNDDPNNPNATEAIEYLKSKKFVDEKRKLLKFLQEFASDSPDIPTCY